MRNLAIARQTVEAEIGHANWKAIHKENRLYDILLVTLIPLMSWCCMYVTWNYPFSSPLFWIAACLHGWGVLASFLTYHDVIAHRQAFGVWGSWLVGIWMASHGLAFNGLHSMWGARHCMTHHKKTFEKVDCDLSGHDMKSRITRFIFLQGALRQFIRLQFWGSMDSKYNRANIRAWYPGPLGDAKLKQIVVDRCIRWTRNILYLVMIYYYPVRTLAMLLIPQSFMGLPDAVRYVMEHSEQDRSNPYWHATLYRTNMLTRTIWMCEIGDCHAVHHIFPKVPMYNQHLAIKLVSPILIKHGVRERTSFWEILYGYYILGLPHGERWDSLNWYGEKAKAS
eukprot:NODE_2245_length_1252_cov_387.594347_g2044_i0.p1 GENE.NODE_2245_length_1252_cov_387.594347_g2044_i0~~NODE_2245_length_1252_cov_387.594347_g2044_i0.p1  ORF type:complete len:396 (-),score=41.19 NODE_2245_length_1252_cov_387.594347_g2044_i0:64-1077(-)